MMCLQALKGSQAPPKSQCATKSHFSSLAACLCFKRDFYSEDHSFRISISLLALQTQTPVYHLGGFRWVHSCIQSALRFLLKPSLCSPTPASPVTSSDIQ